MTLLVFPSMDFNDRTEGVVPVGRCRLLREKRSKERLAELETQSNRSKGSTKSSSQPADTLYVTYYTNRTFNSFGSKLASNVQSSSRRRSNWCTKAYSLCKEEKGSSNGNAEPKPQASTTTALLERSHFDGRTRGGRTACPMQQQIRAFHPITSPSAPRQCTVRVHLGPLARRLESFFPFFPATVAYTLF